MNAVHDAANRALATAASVRKLNIAIAEQADVARRSEEAHRALRSARLAASRADAALKASTRFLTECRRQVWLEARQARAATAKAKATGPRRSRSSRKRQPYLSEYLP